MACPDDASGTAPAEVPSDDSAEDLYENAPCGYLSALPNGEIVRVNATFLAWTGYAREELVGRRRFDSLLTGGGRIYHETHYAPLLRMQDAVREIALDIVCADGRRLPVLVNSVLKRDAHGEPQLVRTSLFRATDRKAYERELLRAREREREAARRARLLAEASRSLDEVQGLAQRAQRLVDVLAASFATAAWVHLLADGGLREIARAPAGAHAAASPAVRALAERAVHGGDLELGPGDGSGSRVALPLRVRGRPIAVLSVERSVDATREDEIAFLGDLADRAALALENARLYEHERGVAHTLQRSLLSGGPPRDERVAIATRYLPAVETLEVGGDWHDAFATPDGRVAIAVGDVVGRGLDAATTMGQLRSAVRALAAARLSPANLLRCLDDFVEQLDAARLATLLYGELDLATGVLTLACAGHPPPVLARPGADPELVWEGRSVPLGVAGGTLARSEHELALEPGSRLLLYTDGLVERRSQPLDESMDGLVGELARRRGAPLEQLADELLEALLADSRGDDDVCLLLVELREGAAPGGPAAGRA